MPRADGSAERENRTVMELARTVLHAQGFHRRLWVEAVNYVVYILNHTSTSSVKDLSPYEIWNQRKRNIKDLRAFGEMVYMHIPMIKRTKLHKKSEKGYFLGYQENTKGDRVWLRKTDLVNVYHDVIFSGEINPISESKPNDSVLTYLPSDDESEKESEKEKDIERLPDTEDTENRNL